MNKIRRFTTKEVAARLGVCDQRVHAKIKQGHFPNHSRCECGRTIMIPEQDLSLITPDGRKK